MISLICGIQKTTTNEQNKGETESEETNWWLTREERDWGQVKQVKGIKKFKLPGVK